GHAHARRERQQRRHADQDGQLATPLQVIVEPFHMGITHEGSAAFSFHEGAQPDGSRVARERGGGEQRSRWPTALVIGIAAVVFLAALAIMAAIAGWDDVVDQLYPGLSFWFAVA